MYYVETINSKQYGQYGKVIPCAFSNVGVLLKYLHEYKLGVIFFKTLSENLTFVFASLVIYPVSWTFMFANEMIHDFCDIISCLYEFVGCTLSW